MRGESINRGEDGGWVVPQKVEFVGREGEDLLQELDFTAVVKLGSSIKLKLDRERVYDVGETCIDVVLFGIADVAGEFTHDLRFCFATMQGVAVM